MKEEVDLAGKRIAVLGYGVEGKAVERYCLLHGATEIAVFSDFTEEEMRSNDFSGFDYVFRSPSVKPEFGEWSYKDGDNPKYVSGTKWFLRHCKGRVIGVTGTKGKGTTSSMIASILRERDVAVVGDSRVFLVGNIGKAALDVLDEVRAHDIVVYEMSSFQLWDCFSSPSTAVVLRIEEDHLDKHGGMEDYVSAKGNIARFQRPEDKIVFYGRNERSELVASWSSAREKISYPSNKGGDTFRYDVCYLDDEEMFAIYDAGGESPCVEERAFCYKQIEICPVSVLKVRGEHNVENACAAITAVGGLPGVGVAYGAIEKGLSKFTGLPHRLQFVREVDGVSYYDDNFSSAIPALTVALEAFEEPVVLIAGGVDRGLDYSVVTDKIRDRFLEGALRKAVLIGENAGKISGALPEEVYEIADSLEEAVTRARDIAISGDVVLMSPGSASFDMFSNFEERGERFQEIVGRL